MEKIENSSATETTKPVHANPYDQAMILLEAKIKELGGDRVALAEAVGVLGTPAKSAIGAAPSKLAELIIRDLKDLGEWARFQSTMQEDWDLMMEEMDLYQILAEYHPGNLD